MADIKKAEALATDMGKQLEGHDLETGGIALAILLAGFIILLPADGDEMDEGIDAIAEDAKHAARVMRGMVQ